MFLHNALPRRRGSFGILAALSVSISAALVLTLIAGCSHNSQESGGPLMVPLSYTPEHARDSIKPYPTEVPRNKIYVGRFEDKRDKTDAIGANVEHQNPTQVMSGTDPAEFFRQTLAEQLKRAALNVVDDANDADRIINGELTHFWVEESSSYQAEIAATVRVSEKGGTQRWKGAVIGHGENFGRSLNAENYRQALSDAMVRLTYESLLTDPEFQKAIK